MAMGVARSNAGLQAELDHVIARRGADIERILREYNVPLISRPQVATR